MVFTPLCSRNQNTPKKLRVVQKTGSETRWTGSEKKRRFSQILLAVPLTRPSVHWCVPHLDCVVEADSGHNTIQSASQNSNTPEHRRYRKSPSTALAGDRCAQVDAGRRVEGADDGNGFGDHHGTAGKPVSTLESPSQPSTHHPPCTVAADALIDAQRVLSSRACRQTLARAADRCRSVDATVGDEPQQRRRGTVRTGCSDVHGRGPRRCAWMAL